MTDLEIEIEEIIHNSRSDTKKSQDKVSAIAHTVISGTNAHVA